MRYGLSCGLARGLWAGLLVATFAAGCLGCNRKTEPTVTEVPTDQPTALATKGAAAISSVCSRQSFATAKTGVIAGETKLREDVFEMRDPVSYAIVPYRLGATVLLEAMLRQQATTPGHPDDQAQCMRDFANHLKGLSDPLLAAAKNQDQVDGLAFKDAEKEAQQEIESQEEIEKDSK